MSSQRKGAKMRWSRSAENRHQQVENRLSKEKRAHVRARSTGRPSYLQPFLVFTWHPSGTSLGNTDQTGCSRTANGAWS